MNDERNVREWRQYEEDVRYIAGRSSRALDAALRRASELMTDQNGEFQRTLARFREALAALQCRI